MSTIWIALEDASKTLFKNFADETVQTVHTKLIFKLKILYYFRYGNEASETAHHALYAAGHTTLASMQLADLGPRAIAGRMAKKAGIQIVQGVNESEHVVTTVVPTTSKKTNLSRNEEQISGKTNVLLKKSKFM